MPAESAAGEVLERSIPETGEALPAVGLGTWQVFDVAGDAAGLAQARETLRVRRAGRTRRRQLADVRVVRNSDRAARRRVGLPGKALRRHQGVDERQARRHPPDGGLDAEAPRRAPRPDAGAQPRRRATHLATLREWKRPGGSATSASPTTTRAPTRSSRVIARGAVDFVQVNYSLAEPEAERRLLRAAADSRTAVIVNRPFAEGAMFRRVKGKPLPDWAREIGCASWAQFFLKWILAEPGRDLRHPRDAQPRARRRQPRRGRWGRCPTRPCGARMSDHFNPLKKKKKKKNCKNQRPNGEACHRWASG